MNSFYKYGKQNFLKPLGLQCGDQRREENLLIQQLDGIQHSLKPLQFLKQVLMLESFIIYTFGWFTKWSIRLSNYESSFGILFVSDFILLITKSKTFLINKAGGTLVWKKMANEEHEKMVNFLVNCICILLRNEALINFIDQIPFPLKNILVYKFIASFVII